MCRDLAGGGNARWPGIFTELAMRGTVVVEYGGAGWVELMRVVGPGVKSEAGGDGAGGG